MITKTFLKQLRNYKSEIGELKVLGKYLEDENSFETISSDIMNICTAVNRTQKNIQIIGEKVDGNGAKQLETLIEEEEIELLANDFIKFLEKYKEENYNELYCDLIIVLKKVYGNSMDIHKNLSRRIVNKEQSNTGMGEVSTLYFLGEIQWEGYELHLPPYLEKYFNE